MKKNEAVFLLIAGLLMGTIFAFGMPHWNAPIAQDVAEHVTATFSSSYENLTKRLHVREIVLQFEDYEQLFIDGSCADIKLRETVRELLPGTVVEMMVHPDGDAILAMEVGGQKLLVFEDATKQLSTEAKGFIYVGIFCYILAAAGLFRLLARKKG